MTKASKARTEKKVAEKTAKQRPEDIPPSPPAAPPGQAPVSADEVQKAQEYIGKLMQGEVKLTNELAVELFGQLRNAEQSLSQLVPRIEQLQQSLNQAIERRTALSAVSQNIGLNLYRWRNKTTKSEKDEKKD